MIKNYDEFLAAIEEYYGLKYTSELEIKFLDVFLKPRLDRLDDLFMKVISTHSKKWKSLPDIAIYYSIEKEEKEKGIAVDAENAWCKLLGISEEDNMYIRDPYIYGAIAGYGTWDYFCERRDAEREWAHKDFINRYKIMRTEKLPENGKVLLGWNAIHYGRDNDCVRTRNIHGEFIKIAQKELPKELTECLDKIAKKYDEGTIDG